jgi:hypothetical protein
VVFSMSKLRIALIAEDNTDCEALLCIVRRVLNNPRISTKKWCPVKGGCSALRRKLDKVISTLYGLECNAFIVVHDLDLNPENGTHNNEAELRKQLEEKVTASEVKLSACHICIPIEELEAWFWSDPKIIEYIGKGRGRASANPHLVVKPKEKLIRLSTNNQKGKASYNTNRNAELAEMLDLDLCAQRCESFRDLRTFLESLRA